MQREKDIVFGTHSVLETLRAGKEIDKVMVQKGLFSDEVKEMLQFCRSRNVPVQQVPYERLNRVTRRNHQGVIAFISAVNYASLSNIIAGAYEKGESPLVLILDRVTDVRNFGAISRTAECAGVHGILIPDKGSAQINSDALKTSSGALNYIPVCRAANLKDSIRELKDSGLQVVACTEKTEDSIYSLDLSGPLAIIMGSEEDGVSPAYLEMCDAKGKIPLHGQVESLNVANACSVIIYEAVRQRG